MEKHIIDQIKEWCNEFDSGDGYITCEFSTSIQKLPNLAHLLTPSKLGQWIAMKCEVCEGYHGKDHVHVSLERDVNIKEMKKDSNFLCVFD